MTHFATPDAQAQHFFRGFFLALRVRGQDTFSIEKNADQLAFKPVAELFNTMQGQADSHIKSFPPAFYANPRGNFTALDEAIELEVIEQRLCPDGHATYAFAVSQERARMSFERRYTPHEQTVLCQLAKIFGASPQP